MGNKVPPKANDKVEEKEPDVESSGGCTSVKIKSNKLFNTKSEAAAKRKEIEIKYFKQYKYGGETNGL